MCTICLFSFRFVFFPEQLILSCTSSLSLRSSRQVYSVPLGGMIVRQGVALGGSGSTYMYAYVDATYKDNMTKEECYQFVAKGQWSTKWSTYRVWGTFRDDTK